MICAATIGLCVVAATRLGMTREKVDLRGMARLLDQQLTSEFTQTVQLAALLARHEDVSAAFRKDAPLATVQDALNRLVLATSRKAILVTDPEGTIIAAGVRNPDNPNQFGTVWETRPLRISSASLSRRFVLGSDERWMLEIAKGITGPNRESLGFVIVYQSLEEQAQRWRALPERLNIATLDGVTLFENRQAVGSSWAPMQATITSAVHGTVLLIERPSRVLMAYGATGFLVSFLMVLAILFGASSLSRRQQLAEAKIGALAQDAATLEALVQDRTGALRKEIRKHNQTELALKESQSQLIQAAKFKVLSDMASGLAHEISQPLFALGAILDTLTLQLDAQPDVKSEQQSQVAKTSLQKAQRVTSRIGRILTNLKSFARSDQVNTVPVSLSDAITSALELLEHEAARSQITLVHKTPPEPIFGMATPTRLQQVIVNLISNSIDAVVKDGSGLVRIRYTGTATQPKVCISDNGPGFTDSDAALTPFYTTKADNNGLGLGLSISADIMRLFGGELSLAAAPQGGASVTLRFKGARAVEG